MKTPDNNKGPKTNNQKDGSDSSTKDQTTTNKMESNPDLRSEQKEGNDHTEWSDPDMTDPKVSPEKVQDPVAKGKNTPDTVNKSGDNSSEKGSGTMNQTGNMPKEKTNEKVTALGVTEHHSPVNKKDEEKFSEEYAGIEEEEEEETPEEERQEDEDEAAETSPDEYDEEEEDLQDESADLELDDELLEEDMETENDDEGHEASYKRNLSSTQHANVQNRRGAIENHNRKNGTMKK